MSFSRQSVRATVGPREAHRQYLIGIQKKHGRLYAAIRAGHAVEARKAIRT
jgi:DNA-binding FadR family transcriptional regulator